MKTDTKNVINVQKIQLYTQKIDKNVRTAEGNTKNHTNGNQNV